LTIVAAICCVVFGVLSSFIIREDWTRRIIPNRYVLVMLVFSLVSVAILHNNISSIGVICSVIIFAMSIAFYGAHLWGAGDAKLMMALSPIFMLPALPFTFLVLIAFFFIHGILIIATKLVVISKRVQARSALRSIPGAVPILFSMFVVVSSAYTLH